MKLGFIDNHELCAFVHEGAVRLSTLVSDLAVLLPQQLINHVIRAWDDYQPEIAKLLKSGPVIALSDVKVQAPLPKPISMVCMAVNYMEFGTLPEKPAAQAFFKSSHSVIGHNDVMHLPDVPASIFEGEAEMALVISQTASHVQPEDAADYIFGYLNFVDGSARGLMSGMGMSWFMKCQDDFAPLGPWITTVDEIADPMKLQVKQWNNGTLTHDYNTDDMAHDIAASIAFITSNITLEAGDVIALGTNHQGLHPLQDGDLVEQEIEGLGRLTFRVEDALNRTWDRKTRAERGREGPAPQLTGKYIES